MPTLRTTLFLSFSLLAACKTGTSSLEGNHWTPDSVPDRIVKHFTGYRADTDGRFIDYQYQKKKSIARTLRVHFLGNSADNPFESYDASQTNRRPPHSPAPDPLYYFGAESLFIGLGFLGISGAFIPIPIESLTATIFSEGGWDEFGKGFSEGADAEATRPPLPGQFRVKNR